MRVLGPALITNGQQKLLRAGAELTILRSAVYESAARRAFVGDRFWVREAYFVYESGPHNCPTALYAIIYGNGPHRTELPEFIKPWADKCKKTECHGSTLTRADSRASLEIIRGSSGGNGWVCCVHMGNIDGLEAAA